MKGILPIFIFIFLGKFASSQIDSAFEAKNHKWYKDHYVNLIQKPSMNDLHTFLGNLRWHASHSEIPLKDVKFYISKLDTYFDNHPEFLKEKYELNFIKAVVQMHTGHPERFHLIIKTAQEDLIKGRYYKELIHLNHEVCHFLLTVNHKKEAKLYLHQNEKVFADLKASGFKDFKGFETVQTANSLGFLYKSEEQLDSAERYYRIGLERAKENQDVTWIGLISGNLGDVLVRKGQYELAEDLFKTDKKESLKSGQVTSAVNAILAIVDIKVSQNKINEAESYIKEADSLIVGLNSTDNELIDHYFVQQTKRLGDLYLLKDEKAKAKENFEKAFLRLKNSNNNNLLLKNSLNNRRYLFEDNVHKIVELEEKSQRRQYIIWAIFIILFWLVLTVVNQKRFNKRLKIKNALIEEQAKGLEELNLQKTKLFSIVAHDMRNPFANLRNLIDLHSDKALSDEEFLMFSKDINKSIHGLSGTFENIMSWAQVGMEKGIRVNITSLNFASLVSEIILQTQPICEAKSISIQYIEDDSDAILVDKNLMLVVLRNLIQNAIKFSHIGSQIIVQYSINPENRKEASVQIIDKGVGMNEEQLNRLINSNSNHSHTGTQGEKGSGLGLMICKDFIVAMNGRLKIESKVGEGSVFKVFLPLSKQ